MTLTRNDPTTHQITQKFDEPIRQNIAEGVITWDQVCHYINSKELYKLRRSAKETQRYHKHKDSLKRQNITILQYILNKLSWNEPELDQLNDLTFATDQQRLHNIFTKQSLFKTQLNDFPYYYEDNVMHLLIWSKIKIPLYLNDTTDIDMFDSQNNNFPDTNPSCVKIIDQFLKQTLCDKFNLKPGKDYVWFLNYSNLQSIKAISHLHVLIRWKDHEENVKMQSVLLKDNVFEPVKHSSL